MEPRLQDIEPGQFQTLLENLKWKAVAWIKVLQELDPLTLAGIGGGLVTFVVVIWALKKVLSGSFGGAPENATIRRDAKKAR
ncbi:MAG TPA: hypothetical protein VIU33_09745, partial [Nitrospiria bacterium]